ncbi:hypothetical protein [Aquisediminimonas profunda]|uniref:hypothetical protein n=1 Tax=Aquisediminimonas profunda TaxID=1550733 RepID=UPI001C63124A|nr:hypothetical protein [Aquisediminimonas profunda]
MTGALVPDPIAWATALEKLLDARQEVVEAVEMAEQELLALHAPDISGVIQKLIIFFGEELFDEGTHAENLRRAIGDLRRIANELED